MAKSQAERNTVGKATGVASWSIYNDPSFDDHLGRVVRRKAQRERAKAIAMKRLAGGVVSRGLVRKLYGEWCVISQLGELAMTTSDWLTAWKWAQRMYGRPF